jgi:hypothetical protein
MDFSKLYRLSESFANGAVRLEPIDFRISNRSNREDWLILTGKLRPERPLRFAHSEGRRLFDLIGTTLVAFKVISKRFREVLAPFSGWSTLPIEYDGKKGFDLSDYELLVVTGRCGPIDWTRGVERIAPPPCPTGRSAIVSVGLYFDPESWDGSDLFVPEGSATKIISQEVKDALEAARITNIKFNRLTEHERLIRVLSE